MYRILLIEDEDAVARLLNRFLTEAGYEVAVCLTHEEGRERCEREEFDLVITDKDKGKRDEEKNFGVKLIIEVLFPRRRRSILISGFAVDNMIGQPFLQKPISRQALLDMVAKVLAA